MTEENEKPTDISFQVTASEAMHELIEAIPSVEKREDGSLQVPIAGARKNDGGRGYLSVELEESNHD